MKNLSFKKKALPKKYYMFSTMKENNFLLINLFSKKF
jgi:hypothetical protein